MSDKISETVSELLAKPGRGLEAAASAQSPDYCTQTKLFAKTQYAF